MPFCSSLPIGSTYLQVHKRLAVLDWESDLFWSDFLSMAIMRFMKAITGQLSQKSPIRIFVACTVVTISPRKNSVIFK